MAGIKIDDLEGAIADILRGYGDVVYQATEEGLDAAQKVLIKNLKAASPKGISKQFAKSWKSKKKYKLKRYVGNTKMVPGKKGDIPLSNILEYSSNSPHQGLIKRTYEKSINEMAAAVVAEIKGVK
ncbi:MAG: hypothetical protein K0S75_863 [Clostridia bacterium]|jgi:hypothetical protein|nr:hypothetical protein [Clostridia bacterium]